MSYRNDNDSLEPTSYWKYFLRSLIVILILVLLTGMMYGFTAGSDEVQMIVLIVFCSFSGVCYLSYWIYIIIHETRIRKGLSYGTGEVNDIKRMRLAILKAHKAQAKANGQKLSVEEIEDIKNGKFDKEV